MTRDFDAETAQHDASLARLREAMGAARERWLDLAAPWLGEYWQAQARAIVVRDAEHANSLGPAGIRSLKAQIAELAGSARERLAAGLLGTKGTQVWPDLKPQTDPRDRDFGQGTYRSSFRVRVPRQTTPGVTEEIGAPAQLDAHMNLIQREALDIMMRSGFSVPNPHYAPATVSWTREMVDAINEYADLHDRYLETLEALDSTRREEAKAKATNLWDEA